MRSGSVAELLKKEKKNEEPYDMKYHIKVEKNVTLSAYIEIEAEDEQKARDKAEDLKHHFHLAWK